ncbi:NAD(P)H-hydrate dehydratase [Psychrosphaera ytuae]|uniref:Bifunctional NAD(P)H-hydrate repair enzyme n=1 Tax=Psychrosphaera ytuae TaxID=2820710 RepID=A0A975DAY1_9GAMM|nr:NAD(P)H-hydrate dehydratase [Psychrosphaera ytuae]QTH63414.1 NAD(P)H-hydrate dehydratase [Psychrosphaera ytuae]
MSSQCRSILPSKLYRAEQIKQNEADCAHRNGIDLYQLMEKAGHAVFDCVLARFPTAQHILIIAGGGNNGGDAYIVARLAIQSGMNVTLLAKNKGEALEGDAKVAMHSFVSAQGTVLDLDKHLDSIRQLDVDVIVDGLIGIGLEQTLRASTAEVIEAINHNSAPVIAIDVPSGLNANTGQPLPIAVIADYTVTFIALKPGLFSLDGPDHCGQLIYSELGLRKEFESSVSTDLSLIHRDTIVPIPKRKQNVHKGSFGTVLVIGGALGMGGAAFMAGKAALRSGVGKVYVMCEAGNEGMITQLCPELMVTGLEMLEVDRYLAEVLPKVDSVVVGPGLGLTKWSLAVISELLKQETWYQTPSVIDADGINCLAYKLDKQDGATQDAFARPDKPWVFTPHPLESARILGETVQSVQADRLGAAQRIVNKTNSAVILKGNGSIVASKGHSAINMSGNPAMATAGMGDVLSGVIGASFCAWQLNQTSLQKKLEIATYLHGLAGDFTAKESKIGMIATDVIESLPAAIWNCQEYNNKVQGN